MITPHWKSSGWVCHFRLNLAACGNNGVKWGKKWDWRSWEDVAWMFESQRRRNCPMSPGRKHSDSSRKVVTKKYKLWFFWEILWETVEARNSKAQWERDSIPTAPPTICHWLDKQPKPHAIGGHVKPLKQTEQCLKTPAGVECVFQALWSLWENTCSFLSSQIAFKKESFHFRKNVFWLSTVLEQC